MARDGAKLHVVMVPYPVQGQIIPMMQFAELLIANRDVDIMVTFVTNKHNHDRIQQAHTATSADQHAATINIAPTLAQPQSKLHFVWVDNGLPPDFDYSDVTGAQLMPFHLSTLHMKEPFKKLLESLSHQIPPVSCVLFGFFCSWAQSVAAELAIPTLLFWTQSATVLAIYYHMELLIANGFFPFNKKVAPGCCSEGHVQSLDMVTYIPGVPPLHPSSLPTLLHRDNITDDPFIPAAKEQMGLLAGNCGGVIINSFEELESDTCQELLQELPCAVFLVGPLLPSALFMDGKTINSASCLLQESWSGCIKWLDGKPKHSVLYISFGSLFNPSTAELEGIAAALKSSKQPFLWVVRPHSSFRDVSDILPRGFVEDTKEYGLIISWAPQVQVLSHPAVGAFLTHCGWNSTLESLSMGMPMISLPISMDQPTNSTYVCDIWKIGMALKRQDDGKLKSEDVEKVVRTVLQQEEGLKMRERAGQLREAARRAVHVQGSSYAHVQNFVQALQAARATSTM